MYAETSADRTVRHSQVLVEMLHMHAETSADHTVRHSQVLVETLIE
jgi:hypothetical protein